MHAGIVREREGDRLREKMGGMMAFYYAIIYIMCMYDIQCTCTGINTGIFGGGGGGGGPGCV